ncbi:glutamate ABC transporter substrate-binding protein [Nocardia arthritidis]|uniref:Transporter substrate-binding domain-containing protein n=1 Tax=Nocardia arthritidis TaxID=228602 RepID=A0A6G9YT64_9NOCA|nr:glutamate ABC transporter substrate-binding protein [Nocardia arthritidis]QIS16307.1 transporter substrate-binding domain-containing protein [Nocardia arthritidis]
MRRSLAVISLAATVFLGGCANSESPAAPTRTGTYTEMPMPAQATTIVSSSPLPTANPDQCGNPLASLRPSTAGGPTVDAIRARGRLIVGLDTGSNLFSFRDPKSGTIMGFDADIAREIAKDLLGDASLIDFRTIGSSDREKALKSHTVDIVAKTMSITCERRKDVTFSTVYLQASQRVLVVQDSGINGIADLAGKRVCVVPRTTSMDNIRRGQPAASLLTVPSWADCLVALQQRQVDAVSTDDAILAGMAAQDPYTAVVGGPISPEPYGIGIPKGDDDLVRFVNATLERIRTSGRWQELYDEWLVGALHESSPPTPTYQD